MNKIEDSDEHIIFKKLFDELVNEFSGVYRKYKPSTRTTIRLAKRQLLIQLYKEVTLILTRIDNELWKLNELDNQLKENWQEGQVHPDSQLGKIINEQVTLRDYLLIDITSLFHWIYIIDNAIGGNKFSKSICAFRNVFIVHFPEKITISAKTRKLTHAVHFSKGGAQLVFIPFFGSKKFVGYHTKVERVISKYIPEVLNENNIHERIRIIWENLDSLPDKYIKGNQRDKNHFINSLLQYGGRSPKLNIVLQSLLDVWRKEVKVLFK